MGRITIRNYDTALKIYEVSRCKTVGGSLVNQIMGASKLWDSEAVKRGRELEGQGLDVAEKSENIEIRKCGLLLNAEYPAIGASPDGIGGHFVV